MKTTIVTKKYRITLPKNIRESQGIKIGDSLVVESKHGIIEIRKLNKKVDISSAFGAWKKARGNSKEDSVAFIRKIRNGSEKRLIKSGL